LISGAFVCSKDIPHVDNAAKRRYNRAGSFHRTETASRKGALEMSDYRIFTDSTTDLTQQLVDDLDITVIPMDFTIGSDSFLDYPDERDISSHDFYQRISAGESSTTNQISISTFTKTFEPFLQSGTDVLYIGFSSGLSGTYNNSVITAKELSEKYPERKVCVSRRAAKTRGKNDIGSNGMAGK
jgi:hypothetical protein